MECPNCRRDIPNGMFVCPTCNYKLAYLNERNIEKKPKKNYTFFFMVLGIILGVVLFATIIVVIIGKAEKSDGSYLKLSDNKPILVKKNGLFGYIDSKGNEVIPPKYKYASNFYGNFAIVSEDYQNDGKPHDVHLVDATDKIFKTTTTVANINFLEDKNTWFIENTLYDEALNKLPVPEKIISTCNSKYCVAYSSDHKTGVVIDHAGKTVYKNTDIKHYLSYDPSNNSEEFKNTYCLVIKDNKEYGITNCDTGVLVYNFTKGRIISEGSNIFTTYTENGELKDHMYIVNDSYIYKTNDKDIYLDHEDGTSYIKVHEHITENGDLDYIPMDIYTGKLLEEKKEDYLNINWLKYTKTEVVKINDKYGLKQNGSTLVPVNYDNIYIYDLNTYKKMEEEKNPYILLENDRKVSVFNILTRQTAGEFYANKIMKLTSKFIYYEDINSGNGIIYNVNSKKTMIINNTKDVEFNTNYFKVNEGNKLCYYNNDFDLIYEGETF